MSRYSKSFTPSIPAKKITLDSLSCYSTYFPWSYYREVMVKHLVEFSFNLYPDKLLVMKLWWSH